MINKSSSRAMQMNECNWCGVLALLAVPANLYCTCTRLAELAKGYEREI